MEALPSAASRNSADSCGLSGCSSSKVRFDGDELLLRNAGKRSCKCMHFVAAEKCALELIDHELHHLLVRARVFTQLNLIGNVTQVSSDEFWYRGWFVILSEFVR